MNKQEGFRSGFVTLLGRPNVGKSSLINALIGRKVAIVSPKPQTTRRRVQAVLNTPDAQVVLVDTPGIQRPRDLLGRALIRAAAEPLDGADGVLLVVDASRSRGKEDRASADMLRQATAPVLLVVNKIDLVAGEAEEQCVARVAEELDFAGPAIATSAVTGSGMTELRDWILGCLPSGPEYYPGETRTDQPENVFLAELIREQVLLQTEEEVPHGVAVLIEEVVQRSTGRLYLRAAIVVERQSHKAIVIGAGGRRLKEIGCAARAGIEEYLGAPVYLELWVKVEEHWRDSSARLRDFGYESE